MTKLSTSFREAMFSLDGKQFAQAFNFINRVRWRYPVRLEYLPLQACYLMTDLSSAGYAPTQIHFSKKERIWVYASGVGVRIRRLGEVYGIGRCNLKSDDTVIDCGANVGEFSALVRHSYGSNVIAIEPEADEAKCIDLNTDVSAVVNAALWFESGEIKLFSKNRSADSSVFETDGYDDVISVPCITLDELFLLHGLTRVKLLKLEAEGAEPEVLLGASKSLPEIEFISADLGPERGLAKDSTVVQVCNFLFKMGFELVSLYPKRQVYLFRNSREVFRRV